MHMRCLFALLATLLVPGSGALAQNGEPAASSGVSAGAVAFAPMAPPRPGHGETKDKAQSPPTLHNRTKAQEYFLAGSRAFEQNRLKLAEREFLRAERLDPTNQLYALSAEVARQFRVKQLIDRSVKAKARGNDLDAREAIRTALILDPLNPFAAQYANADVVNPDVQPPQVTEKTRPSNAPLVLAPTTVIRSFHIRTGQRQLITEVLESYGIEATVGDSVSATVVPFDATNVTFPVAEKLLQLATDTFMVPLDAHDVFAVADTRANRAKYQPLIAETIYFPGLNKLEVGDMEAIARNVLGIEHAVMHPSQGTITIRASEAELAALSRTYTELLEGRNELQLDVRAYEIDRSNEADAGAILPSSATLFNVRSEADSILASDASLVQEIISSGEAVAGDWEKILAILIASGELSGTVFNNPFVLFGGGLTETGAEWNTSAANMLLDASDVKSLNQIQLQVLDQEEATFRIGERYPIMTSSYSVVTGTASSSAQTIPEIQYTDLGLTLKAKPCVEGSGNITLHLQLELDSLAGSSINDIPVLTDREYSGVVSVHPNDSALLVSAMSKQDSQELTGIPGLSDTPGFGDATDREKTTNETELVILITPHVVRKARWQAAGPMLILAGP